MTSTYSYMACMSNKSILPSLVACVEFSHYISVITHYVAHNPVWGYWIIRQYQTGKVFFHWCSKRCQITEIFWIKYRC